MVNDKVTLKFCPQCAEDGCADDKYFKYHVKGYKATYDKNEIVKCLECGHDLVDCGILCDDYITIVHISTDPEFLKAMIDLAENDPIEYQLKMSQFRTQAQQQEQIEQQQRENSKVRCPFCQSTNVRKISGTERATSVIGLGLFSKKINKSFKCNNCGGTF